VEANTLEAPEQESPQVVQEAPVSEPPAATSEEQAPATPGIVHLTDGKLVRVASIEDLLSQLEQDVIKVARETGGPISLLKRAIVAFE
jgi:hypothetical protein